MSSTVLKLPILHHFNSKVEVVEYWKPLRAVGNHTSCYDTLRSSICSASMLYVHLEKPDFMALYSSGIDFWINILWENVDNRRVFENL